MSHHPHQNGYYGGGGGGGYGPPRGRGPNQYSWRPGAAPAPAYQQQQQFYGHQAPRDHASTHWSASSAAQQQAFVQQPLQQHQASVGGGGGGWNPNAACFVPRSLSATSALPHASALAQQHDGIDYSGNLDGDYAHAEIYEYMTEDQIFSPLHPNSTGSVAGASSSSYQNQTPATPFLPNSSLETLLRNSPHAAVLCEVQVGVEQLLVETDYMDSWASAVVDRIRSSQLDTDSRQLALRVVVEMSLAKGGSTYACGRLFGLLAQSAPELVDAVILPTLRSVHEQRETLSLELRIEVLRLFAEVTAKLCAKDEETEDEEPTASASLSESDKAYILDAFVAQLDGLLARQDQVTDSIVKAICLALKLAGRHVDEHGEKQKEKLNETLTRLGAFAKGLPSLSQPVKDQASSLIKYRQNGWGQKLQSSYQQLGQSSTQLTATSSTQAIGDETKSTATKPSSEELMVGPDGEPLNDDELDFLERHLALDTLLE